MRRGLSTAVRYRATRQDVNAHDAENELLLAVAAQKHEVRDVDRNLRISDEDGVVAYATIALPACYELLDWKHCVERVAVALSQLESAVKAENGGNGGGGPPVGGGNAGSQRRMRFNSGSQRSKRGVISSDTDSVGDRG